MRPKSKRVRQLETNKIRTNSPFIILSFLLILVGCSSNSNIGKNETQLLIENALYDFPIPSTSIIYPERSVLLGTGEGWSGRVTLVDSSSPGAILNFMNKSVSESGWILKSSAISEQIVLIYEKENRLATVQISKNSRKIWDFISKKDTIIEIYVNFKAENKLSMSKR
jgi:hypothetical protein